jgi:hypothetical protein
LLYSMKCILRHCYSLHILPYTPSISCYSKILVTWKNARLSEGRSLRQGKFTSTNKSISCHINGQGIKPLLCSSSGNTQQASYCVQVEYILNPSFREGGSDLGFGWGPDTQVSFNEGNHRWEVVCFTAFREEKGSSALSSSQNKGLFISQAGALVLIHNLWLIAPQSTVWMLCLCENHIQCWKNLTFHQNY